MLRHTFFLLLFLFAILVQAQHPNVPPDAEYPFKRDIEKGKYDRADEKIRRRISRDSSNLECHYAAYWLYSTADYARRNLDTAYRHLVRVRQLYANADEKELERWSRDSYSGARIDYDLWRLALLAIADAHAQRTPDAYQHILNAYKLIPYELRDSVTNSRDSLEFDIARRSGNVGTLQDFIDRRPHAQVLTDAVRLRDSLAFAQADAQHTYIAYQQFRVAYPHSHLHGRATDSVYAIDYRDALHRDSEQYYRGYADRYPTSPYANHCLWLADSIEYHHEVDTADWQSIVHYLDSRNRPQWRDSATLSLTLFALRHDHVKAAQQAALRTRSDAPLRNQLGTLLHNAYLYTSILNYSQFYRSFPNLVSDEQRRADSIGHQYYLGRDQHDIDSCIFHIAPYHEAYQLLQQRIKDDLDHHRWRVALATINRYAAAFAGDHDFMNLAATLENKTAHARLSVSDPADDWQVRLTATPANLPPSVLDTMLTADGHTLLFAARQRADHELESSANLYVSFLDSLGNWSEPIELGNMVNTPFDERSPHLLPDMRTLYFSSEGHGSLGGLDVFVTTRLDDSWTHWSKPTNIGKGINTSSDDKIKF